MAFNTDLGKHRKKLERNGYLHLEKVLSNDFIQSLNSCGSQIIASELDEIAEWHIPGKKRQYLYDFSTQSFFDAFREGLSGIIGKLAEEIIISERHIKVYLTEAADFPVPHKDRHAAEFTIGFPIYIPQDSRVCFFPFMSRNENTEQRAVYAEMPDDTKMERFYADDRIVKIKGTVGDMFIFHGSTVFHERIMPAGCMILYIKVNTARQDPLGEHASMMEDFNKRSEVLEVA